MVWDANFQRLRHADDHQRERQRIAVDGGGEILKLEGIREATEDHRGDGLL